MTKRQKKERQTNLKLIRDICVSPPVSEVIETLLRAAEDSSLDEPDANHRSSSALSSLNYKGKIINSLKRDSFPGNGRASKMVKNPVGVVPDINAPRQVRVGYFF